MVRTRQSTRNEKSSPPTPVPTPSTMLQSETSPPILELPNEILSMILSCFMISATASLNTWGCRDRHGRHPILVLRNVCRRFRAVANGLEFWYDDDFEIHTLISLNMFSRSSSPAEVQRQTKFLTSLLTDVHLVDCLERRKSWTFYSFPLFLLVLDLLPLFRQTVTMLTFLNIAKDEYHESDPKRWYRKVIPTLGGFAQLTALHLHFFHGLDFDYIAKFCPALESLHLIRTATGPFHECSGTLEGLSNLREFELSDFLEPPKIPHPRGTTRQVFCP
jgi:F-box-like